MEDDSQIVIDVQMDALIASLQELRQQYQANAAALKALDKESETYEADVIKLEQQQKVLKQEMSGVEKQIQNNIKAEQAQEDSLVALRAKLANLNKQYDSMSGVERMGKAGLELRDRMKALHDQILGLEGATGRMQRNVGNYPEAIEPVKVQLRQLTEALIQMRAEGKQNTAEYQEMMAKAGQLKDAMADTTKEISQMASDTGTLNSVLDAGKLAAGGFSAALGVMTLLGGQDSETAKELAEAQKKLQAAIAVTTGLQAVQNALQKQSALMMGINKIQTWAAAKAQDAYTASTGKATVAQRIFNAVANANPYVLLATAILTVVGALVAFSRGSKEQETQLQATNSEIKTHLDLINKLIEGYDTLNKRAMDEAKQRIEWAKATGASVEDIRKAEDDYFEMRRDAVIQRGQDLALDIMNYQTYVERYQQRQQLLQDLERMRNNQARLGLMERAQYYDQEIAKLTELMDKDKERIDAVAQYHADYNALMLERQQREQQRQQEDAKRAEDERKARQQRLQKQREEQQRYQELTMSEMQKADDALNNLIADQFEQRTAIENTAYQRRVDELTRQMEAEKTAHGESSQLYQAYASQMESLAQQHAQTLLDIQQEQAEAQQQTQREVLERDQAENELYWQNRINEAIAYGQQAGQIELEMLKERLETMQQYEWESDEEFYARKLQALIDFNEKKKQLDEADMAIEKAKDDYTANIAKSMSDTMAAVAGDNEALVKASKIVALAEVAIKQGVAIASAIASSAEGDPYTYALRVASAIGTTIAAMAQAISSINQASFAGGGVVGNTFKGASMGGDNTYIHARDGELVLNAEQQRQLWEIANNREATPNVAEQLAEAIRLLPAPVLEYSEFKQFTDNILQYDEGQKTR